MNGLVAASTPDLEALAHHVEHGTIRGRLTSATLSAVGLSALLELAPILVDVDATAALLAIRTALAERARDGARIDLVWTGPEALVSSARDTAVVVRELFANAQKSVLVAGFTFDHGADILSPLADAMRERGVRASFFLNVNPAPNTTPDVVAGATAARFIEQNWPATDVFPEFLYDPRTATHGVNASLHAKCIVVDDAHAFLGSANFTDRGQHRNIEVGVLVEDKRFATDLTEQWRRASAAGIFLRVPSRR